MIQEQLHQQQQQPLQYQSAQVSRLYNEVGSLRADAEAREYIVADLRRQVAELLAHKTEAAGLRRQLGVLDERVRARDIAHSARVDEMSAKLVLHETVESQLEAQVSDVGAMYIRQRSRDWESEIERD